MYIPRGRIQFESGLGKTATGVSFGTVVVKLGDEYKLELIDFRSK